MKHILFFTEITKNDVAQVGGKNASLGEMTGKLSHWGITVPEGFATTSQAYYDFLSQNNTAEKIYDLLARVDVQDAASLTEIAATIRRWIIQLEFPKAFRAAIADAYQQLGPEISVAVRSSHGAMGR